MAVVPTLPAALIHSLQGLPGFNEDAFKEVHLSGNQLTSIRVNPSKAIVNGPECPIVFPDEINARPVPWSRFGFYLSKRPSFTFDPLLHAGAYYVQEPSSMFLEQAIRQTLDVNTALLVLDLCAAPGGKSTHIQSLLHPQSTVISNELVRPRVSILLENMTKWGAANTIVTNNEPKDFSELEGLFDAIIIDAPCSGSGLFRKDPAAINEWSEANVQMCSQRQQRIIADAWPSLKAGGILIYATCSYSFEEDEAIADFITESFAGINEVIPLDTAWGITETISPVHQNKGYRFYPNKAEGEGFYLACFRKPETNQQQLAIRHTKYTADAKIIAASKQWLNPDFENSIYQHKEQVFALPEASMDLFLFMQKQLNVRKAGIKVGDWARAEIIPDHALAISTVYAPNLEKVDVNKEQAISFLRKEVHEMSEINKGWLMVTYKNLPLGWIKSLGNRYNNYYPKEWRIRS